MKIMTNEPLIQRNRKIGNYTTIASLIILAAGMYFAFQPSAQYFTISLIALLLGFVLSQVGIYFGNRFGRHPRPDEVITSSLKGLSDDYILYNYTSPVPHLLTGPAGVWVLLPYHQGGTITYDKNRWRQKGGSTYLKIFGQESLGRPDAEIKANTEDLERFMKKALPEEMIPPVQAALIFYNPKVTVNATEAPVPTMQAEKLKDFMRNQAKKPAVPIEKVRAVQGALEAG